MSSKVTIRDVAKRAGTSIAAVSYALNGKPGMVGADKVKRIEQAAEELGYRPARWAKQLRSESSKTIAVQVDSSVVARNTARSSFLLQIVMLQGVNDYVGQYGYHVHLIAPGFDNDVEALQSQVLSENSVEGVIFLGYYQDTFTPQLEKAIGRMHSLGLPCVTISERLAKKGMPIVSIDLESAVYDAVGRMKDLGVRQVAYIGTKKILEHEQRSRFGMFEKALDEAHIAMPEEFVYETALEIGGYQKTLELLKQNSLPDCIIYGADHLAMAGMAALNDSGVRVPDDIKVLGVDKAPYAASTPVELASLDQRFFDRGQLLGKVLLEQIGAMNDEDLVLPSAKRTVLDAIFVDGESLSGSKAQTNYNVPTSRPPMADQAAVVGQVSTCLN